MPTTLGDPFRPDWGGYPPHLSSLEVKMWLEWRKLWRSPPLTLYFDVGLGSKGAEIFMSDSGLNRMATRLLQKRADIVADWVNHWEIIELRHFSGASAMGRLIMYRDLWEENPPDDRPVLLTIVTDRDDDDVRRCAERSGIKWVVITLPGRDRRS